MLKTLTRKVGFHPYAQGHLLESPGARWSCREGFILSRGDPPTETFSARACRFLWVLVLSVLCVPTPHSHRGTLCCCAGLTSFSTLPLSVKTTT